MSSDFAIPYAALLAIGTDLGAVSGDLAAGDGAAFSINGLDDPAQSPITGAINDFRDEWQVSVQQLGANIGALGELSRQIGSSVAEFDEQVGAALRPAQVTPAGALG